MDVAAQEITIIRAEIETAVDTMIDAVERGLACMSAARAGSAGALDDLERVFHEVLQACAFQDLTGQRLSRLAAAPDLTVVRSTDPLLAGPAGPGHGLDQAAADALFARD